MKASHAFAFLDEFADAFSSKMIEYMFAQNISLKQKRTLFKSIPTPTPYYSINHKSILVCTHARALVISRQ